MEPEIKSPTADSSERQKAEARGLLPEVNDPKKELADSRIIHNDIKEDPLYEQLKKKVLERWERLYGSRYDKNDGILSAAFQKYYFEKMEDDINREFKSVDPDKFRKYQSNEIDKKIEQKKGDSRDSASKKTNNTRESRQEKSPEKKDSIGVLISEARDLKQVKNIISTLDVIRGSQEDFTSDQIIGSINTVEHMLGQREYSNLPDRERALVDALTLDITRAHGIRAKFRELLKKKNVAKVDPRINGEKEIETVELIDKKEKAKGRITRETMNIYTPRGGKEVVEPKRSSENEEKLAILKMELEEAKNKYEAKKQENSGFLKKYRDILNFKTPFSGESANEEEVLKQHLETKEQEIKLFEASLAAVASPEKLPEVSSGEKRETVLSEKQEESIEKKEVQPDKNSIESKFESQFGIKKEDLEKIPGFSGLSEGRQFLVLENLGQMTVGRIQEEASDKFDQEMGNAKFLGRMWKNLTKHYQIAKHEKQTAQEILHGGITSHGEVLKKLVVMAGDGPGAIMKDGKYELQFATGFKNISESEQSKVDRFNELATRYSKISYESMLDGSKNNKEYRERVNLEMEYAEARKELLVLKEKTCGDQAEAALYINTLERNIQMNQFMNTNPELEKQLQSFDNGTIWTKVFKNVATERAGYFAVGMAARTATVGLLGLAGAPLAAFGVGGWIARNRAKETLKSRDKKARRGTEDASKEAKDFADASSTNESLEFLITAIEKETDGSRKEEMVRSLNFQVKDAMDKIKDGTMNFGASDERLANQYMLIRRLSVAEIFLTQRGYHLGNSHGNDRLEKSTKNKYGEDLGAIEKFLDSQEKNNKELQKEYLNKQMLVGAGIAAGFALSGWLVRDALAAGTGGGNNIAHNLVETSPKIPANSSAAEVAPTTPSPAEADEFYSADSKNYYEFLKKEYDANNSPGKISTEAESSVSPSEIAAKPEEISPAAKPIAKAESPSVADPEKISSNPTVLNQEIPRKIEVINVSDYRHNKSSGSFEGAIKRYLMETRGMKKIEAEHEAARMRLEFEERHPAPEGFSYHKIKPEAQIELTPNGRHIAQFHDGSNSKWPGHVEKQTGVDKIIESKGNALEKPGKHQINSPREHQGHGSKHIETPSGRSVPKNLPIMEEGRRPAAVENIFTGRPAAPRSPRIFSEMPKAPSQEEIVRSLQTQYLDGMRKMSINNMNNWDYIKSEKANNVVGWLRNGGHPNDTKLAEEVNKMMRGFEHDLGAKGRPGRGESVAKWLERVIREKTRMEVEKMKKAA